MNILKIVLYYLLWLYLLILIVRMIFSWVQMYSRSWQPSGFVLVIAEGAFTATDPPLRFLRRYIRPVRLGSVALDLSFMVLFFAVLIMVDVVVPRDLNGAALKEHSKRAKGDEMPLTPADVRNKQFSTTRLRPGYDEEEVDAFLDEVETELDRLLQENEELRAKLAEFMRGGKSPAPALSSPLPEAPPEMMAPPEPPRPEPERRPEPVMMGVAPAEDNMDTAARVLALAQQTADQAIADARREADETLGRARREADDILSKARRQAEQITGDARARAESLERDAQERHRQAMGSLVQQREELERRVDDLRAFEREYRSRFKAYLEGLLRDLEAGASDTGGFRAVGTGPQAVAAGMPRSDVRNGQAPAAPAYAGQPEPAAHSGAFRPTDGAPHERR